LFPETVTLVKERVLLGPKGGGPPPGDGFESAPIKEICDAIVRELAVMRRPEKEGKLQILSCVTQESYKPNIPKKKRGKFP